MVDLHLTLVFMLCLKPSRLVSGKKFLGPYAKRFEMSLLAALVFTAAAVLVGEV